MRGPRRGHVAALPPTSIFDLAREKGTIRARDMSSQEGSQESSGEAQLMLSGCSEDAQ